MAQKVDEGFMKFTKVYCTASGKSVVQLYCRVKPVSRTNAFLNFGGNLTKPLKNVFVNYALNHRPEIGGNFVRIIKLDNINGCEIIKQAVNNMMFSHFVEFINGTLLRGLVRECPYPAGMTKVENATMDVPISGKYDDVQILPNGEQRHDVKIFNKTDDNIISLKIFGLIKFRANTLSGYDRL